MPSPPVDRIVVPHRGVLILVLGILSIVVCQLLGPFVWVMGRADLKQIDAGQMDREGRGLTLAGMVIGIVSTVLLSLSCLVAAFWFLIMIVLLGAAAASA